MHIWIMRGICSLQYRHCGTSFIWIEADKSIAINIIWNLDVFKQQQCIGISRYIIWNSISRLTSAEFKIYCQLFIKWHLPWFSEIREPKYPINEPPILWNDLNILQCWNNIRIKTIFFHKCKGWLKDVHVIRISYRCLAHQMRGLEVESSELILWYKRLDFDTSVWI